MAVVASAMALLLFLWVGKTQSLQWDYSVVRETGKCPFLFKMFTLLIIFFMILLSYYSLPFLLFLNEEDDANAKKSRQALPRERLLLFYV